MANFSIRHGASIRKRNAAVKKLKTSLYKCSSCGRLSVQRISTGIWRCRHCNATFAGGAYTLTTTAGEIAKRLIENMKVEVKQ